jgi:hypothetical protein
MKTGDIRIANRAEKEILKYAHNTPLWLKHICNFELRPMQAIWMNEIEQHPYVLLMAPPRMGKTQLIELLCLKDTATRPFEDGRTWAPKEDQAKTSLKYQLSAIEISEPLSAFIAIRDGKRQKSTSGYAFWNMSNWKCFGENSNFDGENATIIRCEEFDDMNWKIYVDRILQRGAAQNRNGMPTRVRLTGTIQEGRGNIFRIVNDEKYYQCTPFDVYDGLAIGIYDKQLVELARQENTAEDWLRIYLLKFTEARNYIWESWVRQALMAGKAADYRGVPFVPGGKYNPTGRVTLAVDMGHSGESADASVYSMQVFEHIGSKSIWLNGKRWAATTDTSLIKEDIVQWWAFYQPDYAYGDALKADLISEVNDMLYRERLISVNRNLFPENSAANWKNWIFSPIWNTGQTKWNGAQILQQKIRSGNLIIPYFSPDDDSEIARAAHSFVANLKNIRLSKTNARYGTLEPIKKQIGDDDFDAAWMAILCANDRLPAAVNFEMLGTSGVKTTTAHLRQLNFYPELQTNLHQDIYIERGLN